MNEPENENSDPITLSKEINLMRKKWFKKEK